MKVQLKEKIMALFHQKKNSINFSKGNTKFCLSLRYNGDESYLYVNKTEISKFKTSNNKRWYKFCWRSLSKDFTKDKQSEISMNGIVFDFWFDHSPITKEDILNNHQYLIIKNNIK